MALLGAMDSASSGMSAQQFRFDVIGDNLANSTTTGFKSSRVEFQTLLSETLRIGSAPEGQLGGVNPIQVGSGVAVGSVMRDFGQGAIQATGLSGDLAIDGSGFFILEDGLGNRLFTRDGSFSVDSGGVLRDPATGFAVQGVNADLATFAIPAGGPLEDVVIPAGNLQLAAATANVSFGGNLDSGGAVAHMGSVLQSAQFLDGVGGPAAVSGTLLANLARVDGLTPVDLQIDAGDTISVQATKGGRTLPEQRFFVGSALPVGYDGFGTTLGDLRAFLERAFGINTSSGLQYGAIRDNDTDPMTPGISLSAPAVFAPSASAPWSMTLAGTDFLAEGARVGDLVRFTSGPGAGQMARITAIGGTGNDTLTIDPLSAAVALPVSGDSFSVHEPAGVSIAGPSTPWLTAGTLRVAGNAGLANALAGIDLRNASDGVTFGSFSQIEAAAGESVVTQEVVYDSLGNSHAVEFTWVLEAQGGVDPLTGSARNAWRVFVEAPDSKLLGTGGALLGTRRVIGGGQILFDTGGAFVSQAPLGAGGFATLEIPNQGAVSPLVFAPDFSGMAGFAGTPSVAFMASQDGLATGILADFAVGADGVVTGLFSNGATRPLAQLSLARFANPNGLEAAGDNLFRAGVASGPGIVGAPGTQGNGTIAGGALEASNVDFAREFTELIEAQRAFQANARVLSRSDQLLEALVNLV
jgi:flagellar hook protein FlgE